MGPGRMLVIFGAVVGSLLLTLGLVKLSDHVLVQSIDRHQSSSTDNFDTAEISSFDNQDCAVSNQYPKKIRRWCDLITEHAGKQQIPADLVAALIWQESGGNPSAYSSSGAVGLMQVMPRDGLAASFMCINGPCFADRPTTNKLKDPQFNVKYGTRMLAGLIASHGSLREALKAYGPMDVEYYYADKVLGIYKQHRNKANTPKDQSSG